MRVVGRRNTPAGLLIFAAVTFTAACGGAVVGSAISVEIAEVQKQLDLIADAVYGTTHQRSAGSFLAHHRVNDPMAHCMRKRGFGFRSTWVDEHRFGRAATAGTLDTRWLAPLGIRAVTYDAQALAPAQQLSDKIATTIDPDDPANEPGYFAALAACESVVGYPGNDDLDKTWQPEGSLKLQGDYRAMLESVDGGLDEFLEPYRKCMAEAGHPVKDYLDGLERVRTRQPSHTNIPSPGGPSTPEWARVLDTEANIMKADAKCRRQGHVRGMTILGFMLEDFTREHAAALAANEAGWRRIVAEARSMGWTPPPGRLDTVQLSLG